MAANNSPVIRAAVVQTGVESTAGTPVAATRVVDMVPGGATFSPTHEPILVPQAGDLNETVAAYAGLTGIKAMIPTNCSYDDLPDWLNMFTTPVTSGTGGAAPYTYTQTPNATSDDVQRKTIEFGGVGSPSWPAEFQCAGMAGESFELDFQKNGIWQLKVNAVGQVVAVASKTGALSARSVKHIRTLDTKAYLNTVAGGAFGTTVLATRVVKGSMKYETGADPRQTWEGTGDPSLIAMVGPQKLSGKLTLHFSANTEYVNWKAGTACRLRIIATGPTLGAGNYTCTIDMGIVIKGWKLTPDKGLYLAEIDFVGIKDSSISSQIKVATLNNSATLV